MPDDTDKKDGEGIEQSGSGAIATGGSVAAGAGGVALGGNNTGEIVMGDKVTNILPPETKVDALHQLPAPPADFTGREDELKSILAKIQNGVTIYAIRGMGGVGKTALALKLAELLTPDYPDAQFYLDLRGADKQEPLSPLEAMRHVIRSMEPTAKLPDDEGAIAGTYRSLLAGKRALLLWDNARDAEQVRPLPAQGCLTLVTSRQHFSLPGMERLDLETLGEEEARALILKIAPRVKEEEADEIARLCDHLPLALRLAAGALAEREDLTPARYARRLGDAKARLGLVEASLGLSYDLLGAELQQRFAQLGVFPAPFERGAAAEVWGVDGDAADDALGELLNRSLLDYDPPSDRYDLHDLARLFALDRLGNDAERAKEALARHAAYYLRAASTCEREYLGGGERILPALVRFREIWPQLEAAGQRMAEGWGPDALRPEGAERWLSDFPEYCSYVLGLHLPPRKLIPILERALVAARALHDREAEGRHLGNLGLAYWSLGGAREAIEYYQQQLVITRETGNRRGEGVALGNLGVAHRDLGGAREAIQFHEQALVIARETGDRRGEGAELGSLGLAYEALGQLREAIGYHEQHLVITREIGNRRGEGAALGNLGNAYAALGQHREAIRFHEQALAIDREIGDRRGEGTDLGNLGNAYLALGGVLEAIGCYEQHLVIARETDDRRGEGNALTCLGVAHRNLGQPREAIGFFEQALVIDREIGDRRGEATDLGSLANAYAELGQAREAIAYYGQALVIHRETGDRRAEGNALSALGNACSALGDAQRAIGFFEQALVIDREIGDRRGEGTDLSSLGNACLALGDAQGAIGFYEQALVIDREIGDRPGEATDLGSLGSAHLFLSGAREAIPYYEQQLAIAHETGDRATAGLALANLGQALHELGEQERAAAAMREALRLFVEIESPNTDWARGKLEEWGEGGQ